MKSKKRLLLAIILIVLIIVAGIYYLNNVPVTQPQKTDDNQTAILNSADTIGLRNSSYTVCSGWVNKTINSTGIVLFEECGKNCLGGCPNSGPRYCFYGVQDDRTKCLFYLKSRVDAQGDERFKSTEVIYDHFGQGEDVMINGTITLYSNYYCGQGEIVPECSYLIIE
jgi:Na+-transporting NADH:ubiquinone oxidoreductase subunit NqrC